MSYQCFKREFEVPPESRIQCEGIHSVFNRQLDRNRRKNAALNDLTYKAIVHDLAGKQGRQNRHDKCFLFLHMNCRVLMMIRNFNLVGAIIPQSGANAGKIRKYCRLGGGLGSFVVMLSLFGNASLGATIQVASPLESAVQTAVSSAKDGDIISIPIGSATWTSVLLITNGITLQGAGTNLTVITTTLGGGLTVNSISKSEARVTGFTFNGGGSQTFGPVNLTGNPVRLDSCLFTNCGLFCLLSSDGFGVIDHCTFKESDGGIYVQNPNYGGVPYGDGSWTSSDNWGTTNFIYIEDCAFFGIGQVGAMDGCAGARWVFRHNYVYHDCLVAHGTDSTGRVRGTRAVEVYNNTFIGNNYADVMELRSGVGIYFSNTCSSYNGHIVSLKNFRSSVCGVPGTYPPWGACTGTDVYDGNTDANGYPAIDQCGRGAGTVVSGATPSPASWPNEVNDPVYQWGNLNNGSDMSIGSCSALFVSGRDYVDDVVKPGYAPLIYPHPLVSGSVGGLGLTNSPLISLSASSLNFGPIQVGTTSSLSITVSNAGTGVLLGTATALPPFRIISGGSYSLGGNLSQVVTVGYSPTISGTNSGAIAFSSGATAALNGSAWPVLTGNSWSATAGLITPPFTVTSNYISQALETDVSTAGGEAIYGFTIANAGYYLISANVDAPNDNANSLFINIDAEPTDPTMIWDINPPFEGNGFTNAFACWRGSGTTTNDQFSPKVFSLSAGVHELIIRGREANTEFNSVSISPYQEIIQPPTGLTVTPGNP